MRALVLGIVLALAVTGLASAEGSLSFEIAPLSLDIELNVEQSITTFQGWTIYGGSGFAISPAGVEKLQPYTMACNGLDALVAYAEVCLELRAPIIGPGEIVRLFTSVVW